MSVNVYYADKQVVEEFKNAMSVDDQFIEELDTSVLPPRKIVVIPAEWYVKMGITLKKKEQG